MNKIQITINLFFLYLISGCATSIDANLPNEKMGFYSYVIGEVKKDTILKEKDSTVYVSPASCQKIVTTLLALRVLGRQFRYETKLSKVNGTKRDFVISFTGDPTLTSEKILKLLEPLKNKEFDRIILDASIFQLPAISPNIMLDDIGAEYSSPVSSMNVDKNLILFSVFPTTIGSFANVKNDSEYSFQNAITTTESDTAIKISWEENQIKATGNINIAETVPLEFKISAKEIDEFILKKISIALATLNIKANIMITRDLSKIPIEELILVNSVKSERLISFMPTALKRSDNFVFDNLYLKIIHAQDQKKIANWSDGSDIIKELLKVQFQVEMNDAFIVDGSGLSRYNRIQPYVLFELLKKNYDSKDFVTSLAAPGEPNSTLEKRTSLPDTIRAKTGNMAGISCLCGYSVENERPKAFVLTASQFSPPVSEIFSTLDKFIKKFLGDH